LHPNTQKYKSEKETLYFYYNNNNNNRKHIKIKNKKDKSFSKKLKHEPGLKKTGDFTVSEGHMHPLVIFNSLYIVFILDYVN